MRGSGGVNKHELLPLYHHRAEKHSSGHVHIPLLDVWHLTGTLRQAAVLDQPLRLLHTARGQLVLLHANGAASWKLSTSKDSRPLPSQLPCRDLNGSRLVAAVFQPTRSGVGRFFAVTDGMQLVTFGGQMLTRCQVR